MNTDTDAHVKRHRKKKLATNQGEGHGTDPKPADNSILKPLELGQYIVVVQVIQFVVLVTAALGNQNILSEGIVSR